jgi:hypothetical protein
MKCTCVDANLCGSCEMQRKQNTRHVPRPVTVTTYEGSEVNVFYPWHSHRSQSSHRLEGSLPNLCPAKAQARRHYPKESSCLILRHNMPQSLEDRASFHLQTSTNAPSFWHPLISAHLEHNASSQSVKQKPLMNRPATTLRAVWIFTASMAMGAPSMIACSTIPSAHMRQVCGHCVHLHTSLYHSCMLTWRNCYCILGHCALSH